MTVVTMVSRGMPASQGGGKPRSGKKPMSAGKGRPAGSPPSGSVRSPPAQLAADSSKPRPMPPPRATSSGPFRAASIPRASRSTAASAFSWAASLELCEAPAWEAFAERAGGEWEGYHVSFSPGGVAMELPPHVVPSAFKEWEVKVFDWLCQSSVRIKDGVMTSTLTRLLPTVGCEADASTVHDKRAVEAQAAELAFTSTGSYSRGPTSLQYGGPGGEVEHCFVDDTAEGVKGKRVRARVVQKLLGNGEGYGCVSIGGFIEEWEGEFNYGASLASCGSQKSPLSSLPRMASDDVAAVWTAEVSSFEGGVFSEGVGQAERFSADTLCLPGGLWSRVAEEGGRLVAEAGWEVEGRARYTSQRVYDLASGAEVSSTFTRHEF
eukprot:CAMPEP_0182896176 /NCGR_PEP_ID=MMETSP0034_2-20130328/26117_1 /TAXON_ID=156128 /ORGANISM="Nephroselmis pyriformis, Strain CCMP717" /LENGTH=378 /DNA_ID=CAMNT_0025030035 /DNA_START=32 /DNA_END=1168 /DNA_ORIENTATION=+